MLLYLLVIKVDESHFACGESPLSHGLWISAAHKEKFPFFHPSVNKRDRKKTFWFATA